jgi:hypothetical protein
MDGRLSGAAQANLQEIQGQFTQIDFRPSPSAHGTGRGHFRGVVENEKKS